MNVRDLVELFMADKGCMLTMQFLEAKPKLVRYEKNEFRFQVVYHTEFETKAFVFKDQKNTRLLDPKTKGFMLDLSDPESFLKLSKFMGI